MEDGSSNGPKAVAFALVVATPDCMVQFANPAAQAWLKEFFDPPQSESHLPAEICRWLTSEQRRNALVTRQGDAGLLVRRYRPHPRDAIALLLERIDRGAQRLKRTHRDLTRREEEALGWIAAGKTNSEIAQIMEISVGTLGKHLERSYVKIGVETRVAAANAYMERGRSFRSVHSVRD